jgi:hypothetical protein
MNHTIEQKKEQLGGKMKSITVHGIDEPLAKLIKSKAQSEGLSINKTIKKVLEEAFGVKPRHKSTNRSEFEEFCGLWSKSELDEFEHKTKALRKVDSEDWQ